LVYEIINLTLLLKDSEGSLQNIFVYLDPLLRKCFEDVLSPGLPSLFRIMNTANEGAIIFFTFEIVNNVSFLVRFLVFNGGD
ncbi:MAG: hypothetical protein CO103_08015, partial [Chloroflexi bacterium CG_4_9_14_3_um_filter_45_9]